MLCWNICRRTLQQLFFFLLLWRCPFHTRLKETLNVTFKLCYPWMKDSSDVWFHFPAGRCAYSHGKVGLRLDCHQLQWTYWQRWMAVKHAGRKPSWLSRLGSYAWTLQDISFQAKGHWWTDESLAVNMGPDAWLNQQGHTELHELVWKVG